MLSIKILIYNNIKTYYLKYLFINNVNLEIKYQLYNYKKW
jgi:hypothetical protein